jgi:transglutaminase-like putative cysteine protease
MRLERILQIAMATLVALSTVLLGMGEHTIALPLAAVIIAAASVYVTDVKGWIRLSRRAADVLGVAAALLTVVQWQSDVTDASLLALLNFVIYGQFILQLRSKRIGTYWLLLSLSFMEAAVATALDESLLFGMLLVVYVFLAIGVLTVFYLHREQSRAQGLVGGSSILTPAGAKSAQAVTGALDASQQRALAGHANPQHSDEAINLPLVRLLANVGGTALGMACIFFCSIPRSERGAWREVDEEPIRRTVGFASEVQLGELGAISESPEEVMTVTLEDPATHEPIELTDEPLFRGVLLTTYANRKWTRPADATRRAPSSTGRGNPGGASRDRDVVEAEHPPAGIPATRQRFVVRPLDTPALFSIYPAFSAIGSRELRWDADHEQLRRGRGRAGGLLEYELFTTGIVDRRIAPLVPALRAVDDDKLLALPLNPDGSDPLPATRVLAARLVRGIPAENPLERVRLLTNYLRDPTNFRYSLDAVARDPNLDPIEDFLTQHPIGHCEYFASALALMLRAVGIPSRLAIGFKGGDWADGHYQVRALHAHAWVEAYLPPDRLPDQLPASFDRAHGGWMVVDPTAAAGSAPAMNVSSYVAEGFKQFLASLRGGWQMYVIGLDYDRQQGAIYAPILGAVVSVAVTATDRQFWVALGATVAKWLSPAFWGLTNGGWFSWRGALATMVIMLVLLGAYKLARAMILRLWRWTMPGASVASDVANDVDFYRRLESLLAECELVRGASQTQREFALAVGGQFAESTRTRRAAPITRQLAELFYRVRFGKRALDSQELATVEQALSDLAGALAMASAPRARDGR